MPTNIKSLEGQVVEITRTSGKVNSGRLAVEGDTLKLKKPDGGRGRPAVIDYAEVHSFRVLDGAPTNGQSTGSYAASDKPNRVIDHKSARTTPVVTKVVKEVVEDEEDDEVEEVSSVQPKARKTKLKIRQPVRRCALTGNPITKDNGVCISLFEDGEEKKFYYDKFDEDISEMLRAIRPDVEHPDAEVDDEEDDE